MPREYATEISNHRTYCVTPSPMCSNFVISAVPNNWYRESLMFHIFAQGTTGHLNLFLVTQIIQQQSMSGRWAALLLSLCLDSQYSQERVESINWLRSSKFLEHHQGSKFKQWIQNTKNIGSHKLDLYLGRKFLDIEHHVRQLTSSQDYFNTTPRLDQLLSALSLTHTSTS